MPDPKPWEVDYQEAPWNQEYEPPNQELKSQQIDSGLDFFRRTHPEMFPIQGPGLNTVDSLAPAETPTPEIPPPTGTIGPTVTRPAPVSLMAQQMARGEAVTAQPGEVLEEPLGAYRLEHPQTPLEALRMPTKIPAPRMTEETGTKIAQVIDLLKGPRTDEQKQHDLEGEKDLGKLIAGGEHALAGVVDFMTSPGGIATTLTGGALGTEVAGAKFAERALSSAFAFDMARQLPDQATQIIDAIDRGDKAAATEGLLNAALSLGVITHAAKSNVEAGRPTLRNIRAFQEPTAQQRVEQIVSESFPQSKRLTLTEVAQQKETDASTQQKTTALHGDVLSQPETREGQVPVKEGEPRVQPQTEGGLPQETKVLGEQIAKDQGLKWGGELRGQWQFDVFDPKDNQPIRFNIKVGATPEEVAAKAKSKLAEFEETDPLGTSKDLGDTASGILSMPADKYFDTAADWSKRTMASEEGALSPQRQAEKAAKENPNLEAWEAAYKQASEESAKIKQEVTGKPEEMIRRQKEVMGAGQKAQFFSEGIKQIKKLQAEKPTPTETVLASQAQTTPTHGLPTGVPDRGPTFASELLEASRQLGALVRSRATLRPGVLGQFVRSKLAGIKQADRIEVGDIRNQKTVAHEIGHSLDGILWPQVNFADSQKSLAARVGTGTGKELNAELTKVSELMRGPMTGSKGHIAYRKRATELIADYVSLWAHDPERARAMAPKFTKGFEDAVARDPNTKTVVEGIRSGNVIPRPPDPTLKKQLAGITGTPPQPGTTIPNQVPAPQVLPPPVRERAAAVAGEGLVKDAVRTFAAQVEKARIVADNWRKFVKSQSDRNDVGAFVEGIGNLEKPGDTIDRVRTRMTPAMERFAKDYRFRTELERQEINQYLKDTEEGEYLKFLEDYLGHFYVDNKSKIQGAVSRFSKESPHAKQRKLPTLKEAVDLGLTPITQDPANTYELTSRINWQVATNRKFVGELKNVLTGSGDPVVVPAKDAPPGWVVTNNPLIQRVYARQTPGGLMLWRGGAAIHPDVWRSARQILEQPISSDLMKAYDAINGFTRANAFAFSLFHDLTLRSAAIGSMANLKNPLRGLFRLFEKHPVTGEREVFRSTRGLGKELMQNEEAVADAAQHGLKFSYTDSEAYQHNARTFLERRAAAWRDVPFLGKATRLARDFQQWRQKGLWANTHDAFKIITYHDLVSKALDGAPPGTDVAGVKEQIASFLNDAYGGQEWQTKFWMDPGTRKVLSRFFLAPDWTLSTIRSVPFLSDVVSTAREQAPRLAGRETFPTQKEGMGNVRRARFWGTEIAALATATAAAQYAIYQAFGDPKKGDKPFIWDNELNQKGRIDVTPIMRKFPWHDPKDPTRHYVNLGKRPQEIVNWVSSFDQQVQSKASRPVAMILQQLSGNEGDFKTEWKQDHEVFLESIGKRAKAIGKEALPFTFMGNQFALSVPTRKGMTKYKAEQAYESIFELASQPNRLRSLLRGQAPSEGTLSEMASQVTDAAKRNGVPAEEVLKRSLSVVRGHHYNEFFKAFEKGDQKKMDEEARALVILGGTTKAIEESIKRRMAVQPIPLSE